MTELWSGLGDMLGLIGLALAFDFVFNSANGLKGVIRAIKGQKEVEEDED